MCVVVVVKLNRLMHYILKRGKKINMRGGGGGQNVVCKGRNRESGRLKIKTIKLIV